ncbi:MAG: DUF1573 domain-containing protein [Bacteroidetes bacterium]|nr:DUF1573 domain-containing protein [Bacteroidota bacterium]
MKKIFSIIAFVLVIPVLAQSIQNEVVFKTVTFSFGKINLNKPVSTIFNFTNNTGKPLLIETATAECGCTDPEYDKKPVLNGKDGAIKVTYKADTPGAFSKKVTVKFFNIPQPIVLTIEGEVLKD